MPGDGPLWYAAHTQPRAELKAAERLQEQGFGVFAPQLAKRVRHARRISIVRQPLFPRYVFVAIDVSLQPWPRINGTPGVVRLITAGERPVSVPRGLVESLMAAEASGLASEQSRTFQVDEHARILDGPFADFVGQIRSIDEKGRVDLLLQIMGRSVSLRTTVDQLLHEQAITWTSSAGGRACGEA